MYHFVIFKIFSRPLFFNLLKALLFLKFKKLGLFYE